MICVYNTAYGDPKDLPFDLQRRRMCMYSVTKEQEQKAPERDRLASDLRRALESMLKRLEVRAEEEAAEKVLTPEQAATKVQDWLDDDRYRIQLHRMVSGESDKLAQWISGPELPVQVSGRPTPEDLKNRLRRYEEMSQLLVSIFAAGCYYGTQQHEKLWFDAFQRVANYASDPAGFLFGGRTVFIQMRRYPALLLLDTGGVGAVAAGNYSTLLALLTKPRIHDANGTQDVAHAFHPSKVIDADTFNWMLGGQQRWYTPLSDHLFEILREPLRAYLPSDNDYNLAFNRFEYMRALFEADQWPGEFPTVGRFAWQWRQIGPDVRQEIDAEVKVEGRNWAPLKVGWFGGQLERIRAAQAALSKVTAQLGWHF